jgi:hypothetical protein
LSNDYVTIFLREQVKVVTEIKDQTILQVVAPHGFDYFRVASNKLTSLFSKESDLKQEQPPKPAKEEERTTGDANGTPAAAPQPLSEDFKGGLAQLASFMAFLKRFKPTLHEYTMLSQKLDEVCNYYDQMREHVVS